MKKLYILLLVTLFPISGYAVDKPHILYEAFSTGQKYVTTADF